MNEKETTNEILKNQSHYAAKRNESETSTVLSLTTIHGPHNRGPRPGH